MSDSGADAFRSALLAERDSMLAAEEHAAARDEVRRARAGAHSEYQVDSFLWALLCRYVDEGHRVGEARKVWLSRFIDAFGYTLDTNGVGVASGFAVTAQEAAHAALAEARRVWRSPAPRRGPHYHYGPPHRGRPCDLVGCPDWLTAVEDVDPTDGGRLDADMLARFPVYR